MTKEEILALPAGPQLSALLHQRVLGLEVIWDSYGIPWQTETGLLGRLSVPPYSTNISAAWQVVEKRRQTFGSFLALRWDDFYKRWRYVEGQLTGDATWVVEAEADTAPLAICRAALLTHLEKQ